MKKALIGISIFLGIVLILGTFIVFQLPFRYDRDLGSLQVVRLQEIPQAGNSEAHFFLDTSGDQGCFWQCPKVGLGVSWRKDKTEVRKLFRNCVNAGFGDPFVDGATCDGEDFLLQMEDNFLLILNIDKKEVLRIPDPTSL